MTFWSFLIYAYLAFLVKCVIDYLIEAHRDRMAWDRERARWVHEEGAESDE